MLEILALIGLGWIVWKLSRFLNRAGDSMIRFSNDMSDYMITKKAVHKKLFDPQENKKLAKQVEGIKGVEADETYHKRVQDEIKRLTN